MATGQGIVIIDFGAFPGSNEASVTFSDATISATSKVEPYVMGDDETLTTYPVDGHTASDHRYLLSVANFTGGTPTAGIGAPIYGRSIHQLQGKWKLRFVWADQEDGMALDVIVRDPTTGAGATINADSGGFLVANRALGYDKQYQIAQVTGTVAAALAANSVVFALRNSTTADPASQMLHIQRIRLMWTTIVAFTTPVTAGRRLEIIKAGVASAAYTGGTAVAAATKKVSSSATSMADAVNGGDIRIATTGALTAPATITIESFPQSIFTLSHVGSAGAYAEKTIDLIGVNDQPLELSPGEFMLVRNPVAMDAAGTWQLGVEVDFYQG